MFPEKPFRFIVLDFCFLFFLANVGHGESKKKHGDHVALQYTMPDLLPWTNLVCDRFRPFTDEGEGSHIAGQIMNGRVSILK